MILLNQLLDIHIVKLFLFTVFAHHLTQKTIFYQTVNHLYLSGLSPQPPPSKAQKQA